MSRVTQRLRRAYLTPYLVVRLPSASEYAQAVEKEHRWLQALAPQLPLPIPVPLAKSKPSTDYPHSWSIYEWLDGETATADRIASQVEFARDLADFLAALQSIEAVEGPQPGIHTWFREAACAPTTRTPSARWGNSPATSMSI